ncbi:MAG: long-chain fatty acid--CoA ligase [Pseudomonadota bacterium]
MSTLILPKQADTLDGLFYERVHKTPDKVAYVQFNKEQQQWENVTWNDVSHLVMMWQAAMKKEALNSGDRVAVLLKNSKEWIIFDQAAMGLGLVLVPLYLDDRPDNIAYILDDANVKLLIVQEQRQWNRLKQSFDDNGNTIESLQRIVLLDVNKANIELDDERLITLSDWLLESDPGKDHMLYKRHGNMHALATIVYTSGTTGRPKGVMLSHYNILSVAYETGLTLNVGENDSLLSFLPLSHTFERTLGYYLAMMAGCKVYYSQSVQQLANEILLHKPTILVSVPRIFEQIYAKINDKLQKSSLLERLLFKLTITTGWHVFIHSQTIHQINTHQQNHSWLCISCLLWPVLKKLVADKILEKFGGQLRIAATGGAAIPYPVAKTFLALGLNVIQGYGLTETSPVVSFNKMGNNDPRSIGEALDCVELKLGENNELLIKSPGVMMGYWNNHSATARAIDADGWFHSGDQARIDSVSNLVYITGRIKDILIMSNSEKIPPGDIENTINVDAWFEQSLLVGEGQAFLSAIIVLNAQSWTSLSEQHGLDPFDKSQLLNKKIHSAIIKRLKANLHDFPGYAKIRRVILTLEPWTIENELITPTLKVKRVKVLELFEKEIEQIYH